jgi:DNA-binding NarL/FixJ family response regulator
MANWVESAEFRMESHYNADARRNRVESSNGCRSYLFSRTIIVAQQTVLSVGQCGPDHSSISQFLNQHFDVNIVTADLPDDALDTLRSQSVDLVLINRKLDTDYTDGMIILKTIKADPQLAETPVMIVSNFEDAQQAAVAAGAEYGIGKAELGLPVTKERVAAVLG